MNKFHDIREIDMTIKLFRFLILSAALVAIAFATAAAGDEDERDEIIVSDFQKAGGLPDGWVHQTFDPKKIPRPSDYRLVELDGYVVLRAMTNRGASLVYREVDADWRTHPYISWRWRVEQIWDNNRERRKAGDDYPARIYIGFKYDPDRVGWFARRGFERARRQSDDDRYPPLYTLTYVWASNEPVGSIYTNPYQDRVEMIVQRSGRAGLRQWRGESRNYVRDFRRIFDEEPTEVEFVAIMIDGDDTDSSGISYFEDIRFLNHPPKEGEEQ